jgi:DNA repair exonuclease SbcCD ATPase subunit
MKSGPLVDSEKDATSSSEILNGNDKKLMQIIEEYKGLLENQSQERRNLLKQVDNLSQRTEQMDGIDTKIEHLVNLLADIRQQISALSSIKVEKEGTGEDMIQEAKANNVPSVGPFLKTPKVTASEEEVEAFSVELENKADSLEEDVEALTGLLDSKNTEVQKKDVFIEELNLKLESVSDEKERLIYQLESLNSTINSWQGQLSLLQKLAASDPRYKVIGALKKHGSLSDIQLAFTMGTSIGQIRKYIEDLRELELVRKDNSGRYIWVGQDVEDQLSA